MTNPLTSLLTVALCLSASALAIEPSPAPVRTILERHDQTGVPGKEILLGSAFLPTGAAIGFHTHAGDEFGYVIQGTLIWKRKGEQDRILKTGDSFYNARGVVHSLATLPGTDGGAALSTWIVDKGQPLSIPAAN